MGYNGAETNCGIAHILGILLSDTQFFDFFIFLVATICRLSFYEYTRTEVLTFEFPGTKTLKKQKPVNHRKLNVKNYGSASMLFSFLS